MIAMKGDLKEILESRTQVARLAGVFLASFGLLWILARLARRAYPGADIPLHWPISEGQWTRPTSLNPGFLFAAFCLGVLAVVLTKHKPTPKVAIGISLCFAVASNGILGADVGFANTIVGQNPLSPQYHTDALAIADSGAFVANYEALQPSLTTHSKTHPPGPVLLMKHGIDLGASPMLWALLLGVLSLGAMLLLLDACLAMGGQSGEERGWWVLAVGCLPAIQIYSIYSIDASIAALAGSLALAPRLLRPWARIVMAALALCAIAWLSFGVVVLALLVPAAWYVWRRPIWEPIAVLCIAALSGIALHAATGYDYFESFRIASRLENPQGYRLLADPVSFLATRLENMAEPLLFAGPVVLLILAATIAGRKQVTNPDLGVTGVLVALLVLAFLTGAYRTGETARACLFVWPFLGAAIGAYAVPNLISQRSRTVVVGAAVFQTFLMQSAVMFYW